MTDHPFELTLLGKKDRLEIAVFALVVDAKDDEAAAFYRHHGFTAFGSNPLQLIAPAEPFRKLFG